MEVPKSDLKKWRAKFKHGDATRIAEASKINRPSISRALNGGGVDQETIDAINRYYDNK